MIGDRFVFLLSNDPVVSTSDAEGTPTYAETVATQVRGSLAYLSAREAFQAQHYGEHIEAVAGLPHGTPVTHTSRLSISEELSGATPCVDEQLLGEWLVAAVVHRRTRLRVLLRREVHP